MMFEQGAWVHRLGSRMGKHRVLASTATAVVVDQFQDADGVIHDLESPGVFWISEVERTNAPTIPPTQQ